jgi:hypothetical protein
MKNYLINYINLIILYNPIKMLKIKYHLKSAKNTQFKKFTFSIFIKFKLKAIEVEWC